MKGTLQVPAKSIPGGKLADNSGKSGTGTTILNRLVPDANEALLAALAAEEAARIAADAAIVQDKAYTHTQVMPSTRWVINHGLNKKPVFRFTDSYGNEISGEIADADPDTTLNTTIVKFYYLQTGFAHGS